MTSFIEIVLRGCDQLHSSDELVVRSAGVCIINLQIQLVEGLHPCGQLVQLLANALGKCQLVVDSNKECHAR